MSYSLYKRVLRSKLVPHSNLDDVFQTTCQEIFVELGVPFANTKPENEGAFDALDSSLQEQQQINVANLLTSQTLEKFENLFLQNLQTSGLINPWQAKKLKNGHSNFFLGGYRIIDQLGQGGNGTVFLGRTPENPLNADKNGIKFKGDVAIKVISDKNATKEHLGQFLLECEISKRLDHPNVIRCFNSAQDHDTHYSISEYVNAGDARKLLARYLRNENRMNFRIVSYIIYEAAKGLAYIHSQGLIHRDVKLGNILLMKTGEVKIGDFGFSCPMLSSSHLGSFIDNWERQYSSIYFGSYDERIKQRRQVRGTPDYLSPDQISNPQFPNPQWDIYSLGCSLYFLLTGSVPYPSVDTVDSLIGHIRGCSPPEPCEFDTTIPKKLSDLTMMMIKKPPFRTTIPELNTMQQVVDLLQPMVDKQAIDNYIFWKLSKTDNFWAQNNLETCFNNSIHTR